MDYFTYKRFKKNGIDGHFNIRYGTVLNEKGGMLYADDGRRICFVTSENGWGHFRPNTSEGKYRQVMLDNLYKFYESGKRDIEFDFDEAKWKSLENTYWKNILRTMPTQELTAFYKKQFGKLPNKEENDV